MKIDSLNSMWYGGPEQSRLQKPEAAAGGTAEKAPAAKADGSSVKTAFARILETSLQFAPDETGLVEEARRALEAGELDRPQAIRGAAMNIIRRGI